MAMSDSYLDATLRPYLRLRVLDLVRRSAAYEAHEHQLRAQLDALGLRVGSDVLHGELARLGERGLLTLGQAGDAYVAHLTDRGRDCAEGRTLVDGVALPPPGGLG